VGIVGDQLTWWMYGNQHRPPIILSQNLQSSDCNVLPLYSNTSIDCPPCNSVILLSLNHKRSWTTERPYVFGASVHLGPLTHFRCQIYKCLMQLIPNFLTASSKVTLTLEEFLHFIQKVNSEVRPVTDPRRPRGGVEV
jgi:hypothetical protein